MAGSAISVPTFAERIGNIVNNGDGSNIYAAGAYTFKNASSVTTFAVDSTGAVSVGSTLGADSDNRHIFNGGIQVLSGRSKFLSDDAFCIGLQNSGGTNVAFIGATTGNGIQFSQANGEPLGSVTSAGSWTFGAASSTTSQHKIQNNSGTNSEFVLGLYKNSTSANTAGTLWLAFYGASTVRDGYIANNGSGVLSLVDESDERKKENIREALYGISTIKALRPITFDWKTGAKNVKGFIAQEVKEVLPESVIICDESESGGFADAHHLETQTMIPVLVKAIQEQQAMIEELKAKVAALEAK